MANSDRTRYQIEFDIRYAQCLHLHHAALYRRINHAFEIVALFFGCAAVTVFFSVEWLRVIGAVIAVITILNHVVKPAEKALTHKMAAEEFGKLLAMSSGCKEAALDKKYIQLCATAPETLKSMGLLVYNIVMIEKGHAPNKDSIGLWGHVLKLIV